MASPETLLCTTDLVAVGAFRCPPHHEAFPGGVVNSHLVVFPRTAVRIERDAAPPVVADPTVAVLYRPASPYRRYEVDRRGDLCDFYAIDAAALGEMVEHGAFRSGQGPVAADVYLAQRRLFAAATAEADPLAVDEAVIALVAALIRRTSPTDSAAARSSTRAHHRRLATDAAEYLGANYQSRLGLGTIAREVGSAPHHLSRIFRRLTGTTIHQRVVGLRLRRALELLGDGEADLARLAIDLGFSSHSHFTRAFRSHFGISPSEYRNETRTIMQAPTR